ncbi:helix-turn-helix transcriptional regulator [Clostridium botulinum]|uniref:helix-turn-helix transcriptional regulator n=1 Tax=Clostridium botulinum TaxID=1491 RepID=UPI00059CD112|nr:helix-turn-helix transcriptional regulator [Clostridium botulinum]KIN79986.1 DNA-binding protein [Clostridium botulinum]MCC5427738.1 helix-turn-helix domain-containing protein [Clostridium botulinum]
MSIKNKLLDIRLEMGYKFQKDFAEFLGISPYQYNRYEKNVSQPSVEILYNISKKINKKIEDIIEVEEN